MIEMEFARPVVAANTIDWPDDAMLVIVSITSPNVVTVPSWKVCPVLDIVDAVTLITGALFTPPT